MLVRTGRKILEIHMSAVHGKNARQNMTPEQLAVLRRENDILIARTMFLLGGITTIIGLALVIYGGNNLAMLSCRASVCFIPQSLVDQIRTSGFASVYIGAQEITYAGLLLFTIGFMGVVYWAVQRLDLVPRIQLILLIGILVLVFLTGLAIAGGIIPFGQRIIPPTG